MRFTEWLRPGLGFKRWIVASLAGMISLGFGLVSIFTDVWWSVQQTLLAGFLIVSGLILASIAIKNVVAAFLRLASLNGKKIGFQLNPEKLSTLLYEQRILIKGPKIVAIGGGTGLSTLLRGLKDFSTNITAIVTVADDGGGSGLLREDLGMLPPGDIRNCIVALADTEPLIQELMQYRFQEGRLKGQNFGNLFLAALDGISDNFQDAINKMCDVLAVTGRVMPVTMDSVDLVATLDNGSEVKGESHISGRPNRKETKIKKIRLSKENIKPNREAIDAILEADAIIMGPGSLYTSVIPNLLVKDIALAVKQSKALRFYVCNIMTQPGETTGYNVLDHIQALDEHAFKGVVQYCVVNRQMIPENLEELYLREDQRVIKYGKSSIEKAGIQVIEGDFVWIFGDKIRHDYQKVCKSIMDIVTEKVLSKDRKRAVDYYYMKHKNVQKDEVK